MSEHKKDKPLNAEKLSDVSDIATESSNGIEVNDEFLVSPQTSSAHQASDESAVNTETVSEPINQGEAAAARKTALGAFLPCC